MADTIREQIIQSLETQLKNIRTENGYDFTVPTGSIERARRQFFDDQLPAIGLFDGDEAQTSTYGSTRSDMQIRVEMHADAGGMNRSIFMNRMKASLEKAIMSQDTYHGGLAGGTKIAGFELRLPADDDDAQLTVVAIAQITFTTVTGDPWTQA